MSGSEHTFHIPVMGIGFTIDTPLKVAKYGIDSVIFIGDDSLLEKLRKKYCQHFGLQYEAISKFDIDFRARRITSYLNLVYDQVQYQLEQLQNFGSELSEEIKEYFNFLPDNSPIKLEFFKQLELGTNLKDLGQWLRKKMLPGDIDVNIMTKLDRLNYSKQQELPVEYNDAHAALRGYAQSKINSSVIFSAGMNPRLFSYLESFDCFYPDKSGHLQKKIILKVSDYRSAEIQGRFLAKKGIWVSEFRIESGLNCGGHAFATDGFLLGPILEEFKLNKGALQTSLMSELKIALAAKNRIVPEKELNFRLSAQGGVGTHEEHEYLLNHYAVDSVGWGTPFLLVPEATSVDEGTMIKLMEAKEEDLYLSDASPLGIPFNNLRGNSKDQEKKQRIDAGRPGSPCIKEHLALNTEFSEKPLCTASRKFQSAKLKELRKAALSEEQFSIEYDKIIEKSCLCVGLGTSALLRNEIDHKAEGAGVLICPGPNMAYFSKKVSLKQMIDHIYGRTNLIERTDRPNMFIKELILYLNFLENKLKLATSNYTPSELKYFRKFILNLDSGITYYKGMVWDAKNATFLMNAIQKLEDLKARYLQSEYQAV